MSETGLQLIMCDADGTLFPSEEPAFEASVRVVNALLASLGTAQTFTAEELRQTTTGQNFRRTAAQFSETLGCPLSQEELEPWVRREVDEVTAHLARALRPDAAVQNALRTLSNRFRLAAVTSSALIRLNACLDACDLDEFFPSGCRFSAEDSLATPRSKPHPDIYLHALTLTSTPAEQVLAVEDSVAGVESARAAGIRTLGSVAFVPAAERPATSRALRDAGAYAVVSSWPDVVSHILGADAGGFVSRPALVSA